MGEGLKNNLRKAYDDTDSDTTTAQREVNARVCLQRFFDNLEVEASKAEAYINTYNQNNQKR